MSQYVAKLEERSTQADKLTIRANDPVSGARTANVVATDSGAATSEHINSRVIRASVDCDSTTTPSSA